MKSQDILAALSDAGGMRQNPRLRLSAPLLPIAAQGGVKNGTKTVEPGALNLQNSTRVK
jgi:hypothetical protein